MLTALPAARIRNGVRRSADAAKVALRAERDEGGWEPERDDPEVRDGVVGRLVVRAHQLDEGGGENGHRRRKDDAHREAEPERLRAEPPRRLLLTRAGPPRPTCAVIPYWED